MSSVHWGDVPTWIAAVATVAAAVGAFIAARIAFNQLKDQRAELSRQADEQARIGQLQQLQIEELQRRADADKRAQANQVYITSTPLYGDDEIFDFQPHWKNASALPVYEVIVKCYAGKRTVGIPVLTAALEPGEIGDASVLWDPQGEVAVTRATITFRDAAGLRWRMDDKGVLQEIAED